MLHTGARLLTEKLVEMLWMLSAEAAHVEVEATSGIYQRMITFYRHDGRTRGRGLMVGLIDSVTSGVPAALVELNRLGQTLKKRFSSVRNAPAAL